MVDPYISWLYPDLDDYERYIDYFFKKQETTSVANVLTLVIKKVVDNMKWNNKELNHGSNSRKQIQEIRQILSEIIKEELQETLSNNSLDNIFLNKKETCNYLKISNNTLDEWILKGLPVIRIGKIVRFKINDINNWMSEFENTA